MTKEQLEALFDYIDARIDEKLATDHGRDALHEAVAVTQFRKNLLNKCFGE